MNKRKLTRESLTELAKRMPVLSECQQMAYVGGYDDHDCWWRCIAYIQSDGKEYTRDDAMAIASGFFGDNFNKNHYAFSGNIDDFKKFVSNYFGIPESGTYNLTQIMVFDPNNSNISGLEGDGFSSHSVIIKNYYFSNGEMYYDLFDPQAGVDYQGVKQSDISMKTIVNVKK